MRSTDLAVLSRVADRCGLDQFQAFEARMAAPVDDDVVTHFDGELCKDALDWTQILALTIAIASCAIRGASGPVSFFRTTVSVYVSQRAVLQDSPTGGACHAQVTFMLDRLSLFFRSAPRPALLGLLLFFCAGFADGMLIPFFPLWANDEAGVPVGAIGLLFGCYAGGELVAAPLIGGIADRVGRRPVLIASSLGVGGGFVALFFVHGVVAAAVVLLLIGMCESVLHPTILTVIGDVIPEVDHRYWFSLTRVSSSAGHILGPALGAALALLSLGTVFLAAGGILLLGGIAMSIWLAETANPASHKDDEEEEGLSALLPAFRDRRLAGLLLWVILFEVAGSWIESVLPLYARDAGILTPSGIGTLFAFEGALMVGLQMLVSGSVKNRSGRWLTVCAGLATIAGFTMLAISASIFSLICAVSLCAITQMLIGPLVPTAVNALAPPTRRASYMAASSVAIDLKDSLGPSIGTALYALAPRLPWIVGIPLVVAAALGLGVAVGRARRADERLEDASNA